MARKNCTAYLAMIALISVINAGCKPKPIATESGADAHTQAGQPADAKAHTQQSAVNGQRMPEISTHSANNDVDDSHQHADINAVADKLDPETKANLQQLIDERKQAKPEVQPLAGGGERVQLNGTHSAIAVAVANEDGEVTVYHHGENLKPDVATDPQTAVEKTETVKPYSPVKKINATINTRD